MEDAVYREFLELERPKAYVLGAESHGCRYRTEFRLLPNGDGTRLRMVFHATHLTFGVGRDPGGARVLMDLGCGVGGMLEPMAAYGTVVGTDVHPKGLEHCHARGFQRLTACEGPQLPFVDGAFHCVTAFDALEHIEDDVGTLREIRRTLRPGGVLVASGPAYQFLYAQQDRITHHVRRYTRGEFTRKAREAGLEVLQASYINVWLAPAILPAVLALKAWQAVRKPSDEGAGSNVGIGIPEWLNELLARVFGSEARLLRVTSAPFGHSLIMVARRP